MGWMIEGMGSDNIRDSECYLKPLLYTNSAKEKDITQFFWFYIKNQHPVSINYWHFDASTTKRQIMSKILSDSSDYL